MKNESIEFLKWLRWRNYLRLNLDKFMEMEGYDLDENLENLFIEFKNSQISIFSELDKN